MASDRTSQTGEATAGFVQRPTIPPRSRHVTSHSPLEIAAEYRAIVTTNSEKISRTLVRSGTENDSGPTLFGRPWACGPFRRTKENNWSTQ